MGGASEPCGIPVVIAETAETSGCKSHFLKLWQTIFSTEQSLEGRFLGGTQYVCDVVPGVYKFQGQNYCSVRGTML